MLVKCVSGSRADEIIEDRKPLGKFIVFNNDDLNKSLGRSFTGIDNEDGCAWAEDFSNLHDCYNWLVGRYNGC